MPEEIDHPLPVSKGKEDRRTRNAFTELREVFASPPSVTTQVHQSEDLPEEPE